MSHVHMSHVHMSRLVATSKRPTVCCMTRIPEIPKCYNSIINWQPIGCTHIPHTRTHTHARTHTRTHTHTHTKHTHTHTHTHTHSGIITPAHPNLFLHILPCTSCQMVRTCCLVQLDFDVSIQSLITILYGTIH